MLTKIPYNREAATQYANKWALSRNPRYYDFERIGGDCTNFASQSIYAGCGVMNYTPVMGWYYNSVKDRTPSWSGVQYLYNFLIYNKSVGPFAEVVDKSRIEPGDIVQFGDELGRFYHSPVVVSIDGDILLAAHTFDAINRPLSSYIYAQVRYIHILGVRKNI